MMKNQQDVPACNLLNRIKILLQFDYVRLSLNSRTLWRLREWPNAKMSVFGIYRKECLPNTILPIIESCFPVTAKETSYDGGQGGLS